MIALLTLLLACGVPQAKADTYERNYGIVRIEFSDAVCFCPDPGVYNPTRCSSNAGVSCFPKSPPSVEK
jgi:hypothetical protein